jgi:hypothetical protein
MGAQFTSSTSKKGTNSTTISEAGKEYLGDYVGATLY